MQRWLLLLGGPLIWATHFGSVYLIASISFELAAQTTPLARGLIIAAGVIAVFACGWLCWAALRIPRREPLDIFWRTVTLAGAATALIAIIWQTLPAFAPLEGTAEISLS